MVTRGESSAYQGPTDIIILSRGKDQNSISLKEFWLAILFCNNEPFAAPIDYHYPLQRTNHGNLLFFYHFDSLFCFWSTLGAEVRIEEGLIRLRILWYPPPSHCSSSTIPRESGSLENPPLPSSGSLYPELTNEFLTLGLLLRWLLKIITLNRDLSGTLFRTDALAKKVQHKIICL